MNATAERWFAGAPRATAIAAVLLVLHWILPVAWLTGGLATGQGPGPGYASGLSAGWPFQVPRLQSRAGSVKASAPNPEKGDGVLGGVKTALTPVVPDLGGDCVSGLERLRACPPLLLKAATAFDARGPPHPG